MYKKEIYKVTLQKDKILAIDYVVLNFAVCVIEGNSSFYIIDAKEIKRLLGKKFKK